MFSSHYFSKIAFLLLSFAMFFSCTQQAPEIDFDSLSEQDKRLPENAMASMTVASGLKLNLFASEPMIMNPTNMAVDARGRVWICEGRNYRLFANPNNPYDEKGDRIMILEDTNGDGVADKSKVFYQGEDVNSALGIVVLGNKVIVSISPNIFIFTDDDGDDIPDSKVKLFTGMDGAEHDHGVHAVVFGPDGRLYFNYGNVGEQLRNKDGDPVLDIHGIEVNASGNPYREGMAFRCEPDGSNLEVLGNNFRNPYELALDSYGGLWQSDNDDDGNRGVRINFLMEYGNYGYRDKLTGGNWRERRPGWNEEIPLRHWHLNDPGTVPNLLQTGSGSPCGMIVYEGDMLPEMYRNQLIHCEPGHNVVRSYIVSDDGAGYKAKIENIITSKDDWFRPDDVTVAPDGSLFISDWYDGGVGGHRAEDIARGRVYHLSTSEKYKIPKFDFTSGEGAANGLLSDNMDVFYQSWQKLHSMGDEAIPLLNNLIEKGGIAKARALWVGVKIPSKTHEYINMALADSDAKIRMQGIRMARYLAKDKLTQYLEKVVNDKSAQIRREVAIALKYIGTEEAAQLWATVASEYPAGDRWYLEALGIGAEEHADLYFDAWKSRVRDNWKNTAVKEIIWETTAAATVPLLIEMIKNKDVDESKLPSYFRAFHFKNNPHKNEMLLALLNVDHPYRQKIQALAIGQMSVDFINGSKVNIQKVKKVLPGIEGTPEWLMVVKQLQLKDQNEALIRMISGNDDLDIRKEATSLLFDIGGGKVLSTYLESNIDEATKMDVIGMMSGISDNEAVDFLEKNLTENKLSYPITRKIVEALGNTGNGQKRLYALLKDGNMPEIHKTTAVLKLMNSNNEEIRTNAPTYLDQTNGAKHDLNALVEKTGDETAGKKVFSMYCISCHQLEGEGIDFGPGLSDIGNKLSKQSLYSSIIYPSAGINFGYEGYKISMKDGSELIGFVLNKTEDNISIKLMGNTVKEVALKDVNKIEAMDKSLMTEGLDQVMQEKELLDLVAYLGTLKEE